MKESNFTGGLLWLIVINIVRLLIVIITLGIGFPWAICMRERWYEKHIIIDNKQLVF